MANAWIVRLLAIALAGAATGVAAQSPAGASAPAPAAPPRALTRPAWNDLTPSQREALAPLEDRWSGFDSARRKKWLEVAQRYPSLSDEGKQRLHERMGEFADMSSQQRRTARENFKRAYELPADQRQALIQEFRELPEDEKRALAEEAARKADTPRRPTRDIGDRPGKPAK